LGTVFGALGLRLLGPGVEATVPAPGAPAIGFGPGVSALAALDWAAWAAGSGAGLFGVFCGADPAAAAGDGLGPLATFTWGLGPALWTAVGREPAGPFEVLGTVALAAKFPDPTLPVGVFGVFGSSAFGSVFGCGGALPSAFGVFGSSAFGSVFGCGGALPSAFGDFVD
jgi:hypothetical protein